MRALLVDPDQDFSSEIEKHLQRRGFDVERTRSVPDGLTAFKREKPDLVLFDPLVPDCDDRSVLSWLRDVDKELPILIVSALTDPEAAARCLLAGADDYIRKPFDMIEFDARIEAILRRTRKAPLEVTIVGSLQIDDRLKRVTVHDTEINLSPKEYQLLRLCASDPGKVFSHEEIIDCLWPERTGNTGPNDIKQYVHLLRSKLGKTPAGRQLIENVKGFGYRLATTAENSELASAASA